MFSKGEIYIGSEAEVALSILGTPKSIVIAMVDREDSISRYQGVYTFPTLLPPPSCLEVAEVYPDQFKDAYFRYLGSSDIYGPNQDIVMILLALKRGYRVFIYYDALDNDDYHFAELFCEFMSTYFGIFIGTRDHESAYNTAFDYSNILFLYQNESISAREVLFKLPGSLEDPFLCSRICDDLNIPYGNNPVQAFNQVKQSVSGRTPWKIKGD